MTEQMAPGLDFETLRRGIEHRDFDALISLYADDAELRVVNKNSTPSSPMELHGKEEIAEMLRDVCGRAMTHHVEDEVLGDNRVAFNEMCEYPGWGQGSDRDDARCTWWQDLPSGQHRGVGRIERLAKNRYKSGGSKEL